MRRSIELRVGSLDSGPLSPCGGFRVEATSEAVASPASWYDTSEKRKYRAERRPCTN